MTRERLSGRKSCFLFLAGLLCLFVYTCGRSKPAGLSVTAGGDVLVQVGQEKITVAEFETRYRNLAPAVRQSYEKIGGGGREKFLKDMVYERLYAQEALRRGYDRDPQTALNLRASRERVLAEDLYRKAVTERVISEDVLRAYYDRTREEYLEPPKYRLSEIGVTPRKDNLITNSTRDDATNEEEAKAKLEFLLDAIGKGENFNELARRYSEQPSASQGGDLGYVSESDLHPDWKEEVLKLAPGQVGKPLHLAGGVLILRLSEKIPGGYRSFEEMKDTLLETLSRNRGDILRAESAALKEDLESKYKVQYFQDVVSNVLSR
jgi:peptidyl-prolyl cis-trans isomerase C